MGGDFYRTPGLLFLWKGANISSFNVAQLSLWHDLKCLSLIHFNLVNMLRQVANFLGLSSPRRLHIKRVGSRPHLPVHGSQAAGPPPGGRGLPEFGPGSRRQWSAIGPGAGGAGHRGGEGDRPPPLAPRCTAPSPLHSYLREGAPLGCHVGARVGGAFIPKCVY